MRRAVLVVALFAVTVDLVAWGASAGAGPPPGWDARSVAEAPPLARFDSGWYRSIAERGYEWDGASDAGSAVFFPLYPALMRALSRSTGLPPLWAAVLLAHVALFAAAPLLARHADARWGESEGLALLVTLLASPWAFFLVAAYAESLFLLLAVAALEAARRQRWGGAAAAGFLAGLTRPSALALVPPLLVVALAAEGRRGRGSLAALAPLAGVASFLAGLAIWQRDPLFFFHAQNAGWHRALGAMPFAESVRLLWDNMVTKGPLHVGPAVELLVPVYLVASTTWLLARRDPESASYVAAGTLLFLASGRLASDGRYALVLFPALRPVVALRQRHPRLWLCVLAASAAVQAVYVTRFVRNRWVA